MAPKNDNNKEKAAAAPKTNDKRAGRAQTRRPRVEITDPRELPLTPDVLNSNKVHGGAVKADESRK